MSTPATSQLKTWPEVRTDVHELLDRYYAQQAALAVDIDTAYGRLWAAMRLAHQAGGKRLRPYLMMTAYGGLGGVNYHGALQSAAALELLHTSMLIHDDIIDRDYTRHGAPNVAGQYLRHYRQFSGDKHHYANSAALLAGDLALSGAYELILTSTLQPDEKVTAGQLLSRIIFTVAGGELLDTEAVLTPAEEADSLKIAQLKTASYSFVGPLHLGATLAGADAATHRALAEYGDAVGVAFQLADDLLGLFGDEAVTGKSVTSDIEEGKPTYLIQRTLALANASSRRQITQLLGRGTVTAEDIGAIRRLVRDSGAVEEVESKMQSYSERGQAALAATRLSSAAKDALGSLAAASIRRRF